MNRMVTIAGIVGALSAGTLAIAGPADAGTADRDACIKAKDVCVWAKTNFSGNRFTANGNWGGSCANSLVIGHSVAQGRGAKVRFYSKDNCTGSYFDIKAGLGSDTTPFAVYSFQVKS